MGVKVIQLAKGEGAERVIINILDCLPPFSTNDQQATWHKCQADLLVDALIKTLPKNTLNQVFVNLAGRFTDDVR